MQYEMFAPHLEVLTVKHTPVLMHSSYVNGRTGATMTLRKKKYSWIDKTKRLTNTWKDPDGPVIQAELKSEDLGVYKPEEYERNEFDRIATAEGWPDSRVLEMLTKAPEAWEKEQALQKDRQAGLEKKQADIDGKLTTVIANYGILFGTYQTVRMEIQAMAVELPALKGTPYDRPYFLDLTPQVENMAKVHFPELAKDPTIKPVEAPALVTTAPAPMAAPLKAATIKPVKAK